MYDTRRTFLAACILVSFTVGEITVKSGEDALLLCKGPGNSAVKLLEWTKPDLKSDQAVLYYRAGQVYKDYIHPSYQGRVELNYTALINGDFSVTVKNVTVNDSGTYECRVGYGGTPKLLGTINIKVEPRNGGANTLKHLGVCQLLVFCFLLLWVL